MDPSQKSHKAASFNPFEVFGIETNTRPETIQQIYRALLSELHPDKTRHLNLPPDVLEHNKRRLHRVNKAYKILTNPAKKIVYSERFAASHDDRKADFGSYVQHQIAGAPDEKGRVLMNNHGYAGETKRIEKHGKMSLEDFNAHFERRAGKNPNSIGYQSIMTESEYVGKNLNQPIDYDANNLNLDFIKRDVESGGPMFEGGPVSADQARGYSHSDINSLFESQMKFRRKEKVARKGPGGMTMDTAGGSDPAGFNASGDFGSQIITHSGFISDVEYSPDNNLSHRLGSSVLGSALSGGMDYKDAFSGGLFESQDDYAHAKKTATTSFENSQELTKRMLEMNMERTRLPEPTRNYAAGLVDLQNMRTRVERESGEFNKKMIEQYNMRERYLESDTSIPERNLAEYTKHLKKE